jgi:hypothetical protein
MSDDQVRTALVRIGLLVAALAAIILGLNLMNVRNDFAFFAGGAAMIGGGALGGLQLWKFFKGIEK